MRVSSLCAGFALVVASALAAKPASAQWAVEVTGGNSYSAHSSLTIVQDGQDDIKLTAHYKTKPWQDAWYYGFRVGHWSGEAQWFFEFVHHKIYLTNRPAEVEQFQITNGFNMLVVGRGWRRGHFVYSVAAGPVVPYTISTIRGEHLNAGYRLGGATAMVSGGVHLPVAPRVYLVGEAKLSGSYVRAKIANGHADVPNAAAHLHAGIGIRL